MKIIPKLQSGGSFDKFFYVYQPVSTPLRNNGNSSGSSSKTSSSESDDTKGKITKKDIYNLLKEGIDGLPNEMKEISAEILAMLLPINLLGSSEEELEALYSHVLQRIVTAKSNKDKFKETLTIVQNNGSASEVAIDRQGRLLYQKDDGTIGRVTLNELAKNELKYAGRMITVDALMNLRRFAPGMTQGILMDEYEDVMDIARNSMGYKEFQKLVDAAITSLGSSEVRSYSINQEALEGLQLILQLLDNNRSIEGIYTTDKNSYKQIEALVKYVTKVLPQNAKTWAAVKVGNPNGNEALKELILDYLMAGSSDVTSEKPSIVKNSGNNRKSGSGNGNPSENMTWLAGVLGGYVGDKEKVSLNPGNQNKFTVEGTIYGTFRSYDNKPLDDLNLRSLLTLTGLDGISNTKSIYFGDNKLDSNMLDKVAVENNGGVRVILPAIKGSDGSIRPNFELIESFLKVVDTVNEKLPDNATYEQRIKETAKVIKNNLEFSELKQLLNSVGELDINKFSAFFIVDGLASDLNFDFQSRDNRQQLHSINDISNPYISETLNKADIDYFKKVTGTEKFDDKDGFWDWGSNKNWYGWTGAGYDKLYKSSIYIPIRVTNRLAAFIYSNQTPDIDDAERIEQETQQLRIQSNTSDLL